MKALTPTKVEKIWNILEKLKETVEEDEKVARKNNNDSALNYYAGVKKGIQYALNWIDYFLKN